jgi:predicted nucleic acid-binding protein
LILQGPGLRGNAATFQTESLPSVGIPPEVYDEVVRRGAGKVGAESVQTSSFIQVVQLRDPNQVALYTGPLSHADAEVLVLAQEQHADLIITRDRRMRRRARQEGLTVITTFALLIEANRADSFRL